MYHLKRDPGPCPVDDAPHTGCVAPNTSGVIIAGPIEQPMSITAPSPTAARTAMPVPDPIQPPPDPTFTTTNYRGRGKREP